MNEHNHVSIITCPNCRQKAEFEFIHILDRKENAYEKQLLLNGTLFDHKCANCGAEITMSYSLIYVDAERGIELYLVHEDYVDGAIMMLARTDAVFQKYYKCENTCPGPIKRIVMCHHQLREKVLIFDEGLDDRVIELIKLICMNEAMKEMPDLDPVSAEFDIKDGQHVINVYGEEYSVTSPIPDKLYDHIAEDFKELLMCDKDYIVDQAWAMDAMGFDPYEDHDCDGDCAHCPHVCDDEDDIDFDDELDEEMRCENCECEADCNNCPCDNCDDGRGDCNDCEFNCLNKRVIEDDDGED
jgi:hypothetical protein